MLVTTCSCIRDVYIIYTCSEYRVAGRCQTCIRFTHSMAGKEEGKSGYVKIVWCLPQDIIMLIARVLASFLLSPNSVVGELQDFACSLP